MQELGREGTGRAREFSQRYNGTAVCSLGWQGFTYLFFHGCLCRFFRDPLCSSFDMNNLQFSDLSLFPSLSSRNTAALQLLSAEDRWPLLVALLKNFRYSFFIDSPHLAHWKYSRVFCPKEGQTHYSFSSAYLSAADSQFLFHLVYISDQFYLSVNSIFLPSLLHTAGHVYLML